MTTSHLQTAQDALKAEIAHLKEGIAHYAAHLQALEQALAQLRGVDGPVTTASEKKPRKKRGEATAHVSAKRGKRASIKKENGGHKAGDLPKTGGDFWPNLLSDEPRHGAEVLKAAIDRLPFAPNDEQIKKLSQRMTFALNALVKAGKIKDQGKGRERVFFK